MSRALEQLSDRDRGVVVSRRLARPKVAAGAVVLALFSTTLFLSSALLFLVQPMFAKLVLPLLGGTPAVWNTCMVFFQACLLAGYGYAHLITRWLGARKQAIAHLLVLALPLLVLPLKLPAGWTPPADSNPAGWLLLLLAVTVGLPFFVVSTTGPLVQKWFAATGHRSAADPYFLSAASNLGSMLALLGYPLVVEPLLRLERQTAAWTAGYVVLSGALVACGWCVWRSSPSTPAKAVLRAATPTIRRRLRWVLLAFVPSSYLLGVTTFVTTDIAAVPLLWVLPLALYLLTFILVFLRRPLPSHALMVRLLVPAVLGVGLLMLAHAAQPIGLVLGIHLAAFFIAAMVCHGELARTRPGVEHLTDFYLMMSVGGVLGGLFNALLAPLIFTATVEYPIAIVLACFLRPAGKKRLPSGGPVKGIARQVCEPLVIGIAAWAGPYVIHATAGPLLTLSAAIPVILCMAVFKHRTRFACGVAALMLAASLGGSRHGSLLHAHRSFFGVHRIFASADGRFTELYHGSTIHGRQLIGGGEALSYYHRTGPVGQVMADLFKDAKLHRDVAVVGLGVGSLAAYARPGTTLTYYEIDPAVLWAARDSGRFTFLRDATARGADVRVVLGDARLTLRRADPASRDLLVLDAFSGDAVPVHLLTREAMAIYLEQLKPGGLLAVHVSNLYLDLKPVVAALAKDGGCVAIGCDDLDLTEADRLAGKSASQWVVVAKSAATLAPFRSDPRWRPLAASPADLWTDDFSNILHAFRWR